MYCEADLPDRVIYPVGDKWWVKGEVVCSGYARILQGGAKIICCSRVDLKLYGVDLGGIHHVCIAH